MLCLPPRPVCGVLPGAPCSFCAGRRSSHRAGHAPAQQATSPSATRWGRRVRVCLCAAGTAGQHRRRDGVDTWSVCTAAGACAGPLENAPHLSIRGAAAGALVAVEPSGAPTPGWAACAAWQRGEAWRWGQHPPMARLLGRVQGPARGEQHAPVSDPRRFSFTQDDTMHSAAAPPLPHTLMVPEWRGAGGFGGELLCGLPSRRPVTLSERCHRGLPGPRSDRLAQTWHSTQRVTAPTSAGQASRCAARPTDWAGPPARSPSTP